MVSRAWIAFDCETTGFLPDARLIEIGAVSFQEDGTVNSEFQELVRPPGDLPDFITDLTGITPTMLVGARSAAEVLEDFFTWAPSEATFVAHNVCFDLAVIRSETAHWPGFSARLFVDSLPIARAMKEFPDNRLETIAICLGCSDSPCHRALNDARTVFQLMLRALSYGYCNMCRKLIAGMPAPQLLSRACRATTHECRCRTELRSGMPTTPASIKNGVPVARKRHTSQFLHGPVEYHVDSNSADEQKERPVIAAGSMGAILETVSRLEDAADERTDLPV